ncbi:tRNA-splicing endonuclease subunit [Tulasnella sp. 417]|nr:tRNA-splicing endonuclease subunit [Tulasnella sp. 417]
MSTKIPVHISNNKAYVWDVESAEIVRTKYHITGLLTGTLPSLAQQNVFLGLPLSLMPEEVVYLVEKEAAVLLDNASANVQPPSEADLADWRKGVAEYRVASQDHLAEIRKQKETAKGKQDTEEAQRKRMEREARKKSAATAAVKGGPADGATETVASSSGGVDDVFIPDEVPSTPQLKPHADTKGEDLSYTVLIPATPDEHPWFRPPAYETIQAAREAGVWRYPSTPIERAKCAVYRDLIDKGYFIGGGLKFGGDWLVYPGDQLRYHSHFVATVLLTSTTKLTPMQIVAYGRLGTVTKKAHLLCGWDENSGKKRFSLGTDPFRVVGGNQQELWLYRMDQASNASWSDSNGVETSMTDASMDVSENIGEQDAHMAIDGSSPSKSFTSLEERPLRQPAFMSHLAIEKPTSTQAVPAITRSGSDPFLATSFRHSAFASSTDASSPFNPPFLAVPPVLKFIPPTPEAAHDVANLNARGYESPLQVKSMHAETPQFKRRGSAPTMGPRADSCGGALEYVPDALSFVCVSCGIMSDPNQYFLVGDVDDANATGYEKEGMSLVFHPYAQTRTDNDVLEDTSLLKEQRYRRNMAASHEFIRSVLNHMGIRSYYDRVVALFDASMAKGKFRFGTRATAIIGACILITMREAGIPETLKSLAARLKLTPARLTGSTYKILSLHGMHLKPTDPLNYIPAVLRAISDILASPSGSLPTPLRTYLSTPSLNAVQNLATDLCYLTEIVNLTHNRQAPPVACALVIVALEGETGKCVPSLPRLAELLSMAFNASRETTMDRYLEVQELISRWKTSLPWFAIDVHPTVGKKSKNVKKRKAAQPEREEHAGLIKDIVIFQEELWRKAKEMESAAEALSNGGPSHSITSGPGVGLQVDLALEVEGSDIDAASDEELDGVAVVGRRGARDEESLELAGSPSTSGATADSATNTTPSVALRDTATNPTSTRGLSPPQLLSDDGQDSEVRPAKRLKRVPEVASTKLRGNFTRAKATPIPTATTATACLRPVYAQRSKKRKSKRETWDANLAKATATLLGGGRGSIASSGRSGGGGESRLGINVGVDGDDSVGDFVRKHVLAMGIREASERMGTRGVSLGRLERLALVVGEANIGDDVLFDDGEMEGYLRDNTEVEILKKIWEAEHGADEGGYDEDGDGVEREDVPGSASTEGGAQRTRKAAPPPKPKKGKKEKQVKTMNYGALELALSSLDRGSPSDASGSGASSVTGESSTIEKWELDLLERLVDEEDKEDDYGDDEDKDGYGDDREEDGYYRTSGGMMSYDPYEEFEEL